MINYKQIAEEFIEQGYTVTPVDNKKSPHCVDKWQNNRGSDILKSKYNPAWNKAKGIGLLCGEASQVIVLDIDILSGDELRAPVRKKLEEILPPVFSGRTGNKQKPVARFYQYTGEKTEHFDNIKVDILSSGSQAVMPPSQHPNGYNYEWNGRPLLEITPDELPILDESVLVLLRELNQEYSPKEGDDPRAILKSMAGRCKSGSHNFLSKIGVAMRFANEPIEKVIERMISEDRKINEGEPSFYFNCKSRNWKTKNIESNAQDFVKEIFDRNKPDPVHEKYPSLKNGFFINIAEESQKSKWIPDYSGMGKYFQNELNLKCDDSYLSLYDNGYFKDISKTGMLNKIYLTAKERTAPHQLENFRKIIKAACFFPKTDFEPPIGLVNVSNGVLDVNKKELLEHNPKYNFKYKLKHEFNSDAKAPNFIKYLNFVFNEDQELIKLVGEIMGYTLLGGPPTAHRAFVLYGDGRNGKSTLLDVITQLLGEDSVSAVSMKRITEPFSTVRMDGKLANIVEESPTSIDAEIFKNITAGGRVAAAHKGMEEFDLRLNCRLFFACNNFPHFKDGSVAIKDRLIFLPFNRYIRPEERDPNIGKEIQKEMSGVLNFALKGLERFQLNGFTQPQATKEIINEYLNESDNVRSWFDENIEFKYDLMSESVLTKDLYYNYKSLCLENGQKLVAYNTFSKRLKRILNDLGNGQFTAEDLFFPISARDKKNRSAYKCIKIVDNYYQQHNGDFRGIPEYHK